MTEPRRFSQRQRDALYAAAEGRCQKCGTELGPDWHADHVTAYARGGTTNISNGQALCPPCNLSKGSGMQYKDSFKPRPFQQEVIKSVGDGILAERDHTIVLASPGSGKTLAYQAAATYLRREGHIDFVLAFAPRRILAQQCETSWAAPKRLSDGSEELFGNITLFDPRCRMGKIRHTPNRSPLTEHGVTGVGVVTTYSALVTRDALFLDWAREHQGRFLLIADEAQFCGAADERDSGTRAGGLIEKLHTYSAHTLLLTGTPYRSDGQKLILASYDEAGEDGKRRLLSHAEAGYATGVANGYLRRFEATVTNARVRWRQMDNASIDYDLSTSGVDLVEVLRRPKVYEAIADDVVEAVIEKQRIHSEYRGLISCMEQKDAKKVAEYLRVRYPRLRVLLAISEDGPEAERTLKEFRVGGSDILVTVRKAFIGYDCPQITVVGILTHYRDPGHLEQLVGRGLRNWDQLEGRQQSCRAIGPDDPALSRFFDYLRGESEAGLRERARREEQEADREPRMPRDDELGFVEDATPTTKRAVSNDVAVGADDYLLISEIKHEIGAVEDITLLAEFAEKLGLKLGMHQGMPQDADANPDPFGEGIPLTEQEQVDAINRQVSDAIKKHLSDRQIRPKDPGYGKAIERVTASVNRAAGFKADECRTVTHAMARLNAAWRLDEDER